MDGVVSNVVIPKKYGFITGDNGQEYFFHRDDLQCDWDALCRTWLTSEPIKLTFKPLDTPKGPRAAAIRRIDEA